MTQQPLPSASATVLTESRDRRASPIGVGIYLNFAWILRAGRAFALSSARQAAVTDRNLGYDCSRTESISRGASARLPVAHSALAYSFPANLVNDYSALEQTVCVESLL